MVRGEHDVVVEEGLERQVGRVVGLGVDHDVAGCRGAAPRPGGRAAGRRATGCRGGSSGSRSGRPTGSPPGAGPRTPPTSSRADISTAPKIRNRQRAVSTRGVSPYVRTGHLAVTVWPGRHAVARGGHGSGLAAAHASPGRSGSTGGRGHREIPWRRPARGRSERRDEDRLLARRVRLEEPHDLVVVEGEPRGPEPEPVRAEVQPPAEEPGGEVDGPIAAAAPARQDRVEVGEEERDGAGVRPERLLEAELAALPAELAGPQEPQGPRAPDPTRRRPARAPRRRGPGGRSRRGRRARRGRAGAGAGPRPGSP